MEVKKWRVDKDSLDQVQIWLGKVFLQSILFYFNAFIIRERKS
jgi:hypothetical protein